MANEIDIKAYFSNVIEKRKADICDAEKQLDEVEKKADTIANEDEAKEVVDEATALKDKIEALKAELAEAEAQLAELDKPAEEQPNEARNLKQIIEKRGANKMEEKENLIEKRAKEFVETKQTKIDMAEVRSTLLSSGGIAKPTKVSGINDMFPTSNSVVDQVFIDDVTGCGNYKVSFQKTLQEASAKTDGTAQEGSDPTFGLAEIKPYLIATTSYVSKELRKQSPLNYLDKVKQGAMKALRVKIADLIFNGASTNFYGIKNAVDTGSNSMVDTYAVTATNGTKPTATASFLRNLVLSYGGDDNAYGGAGVLYLNKKDLIALGDVRGTNDKKALYEIIPDEANPNTGIIKEGGFSVKYCISSQLTSLFDTEAETGVTKQTMIYGVPNNYNLSLFGDYTIEESKDYKFAEGLITILGEVMVGGNVQVWKGFTVVTLATA